MRELEVTWFYSGGRAYRYVPSQQIAPLGESSPRLGGLVSRV